MKRYGQYEERTPRVPPEFLQEIVVHIIGTIRKCKATYEVAIALTWICLWTTKLSTGSVAPPHLEHEGCLE